MPSIRFNYPAKRLVRLFVGVCVCALLLFSSPLSAFATTSSPTEGEANLTEIELKSQEAAESKPYSLEKTEEEANQGINEVQGDADKDKMLNPENTKDTPSFEKQVETVIESITHKGK